MRNRSILYVVIVAVIGLFVSVITNSQGLEAFYSIYIATGIVLGSCIFQLARHIVKSKNMLLVKIAGILLLVFALLVFASAIISPIAEQNINPGISTPEADWIIVGLLVFGYVVQIYLSGRDKKVNLNRLFVRMIAAVLSIVVMFVAFLEYFGIESEYRSIALVVSVQLLYISNFIYTDTEYVQIINNKFNSINSKNTTVHIAMRLIAIGLPFILPLFILLSFN